MVAFLDYLPRGNSLSDAEFKVRHTFLQWVLLAHLPGLLAFGVLRGYRPDASLEAIAVPAAFLVLSRMLRSRRLRGLAVTAGLSTCSVALTVLAGGAIEAHFHFFITIGFIALYQDWVPFGWNAAFTTFSHGIGTWLVPNSFFSHEAGRNDPWTWALIHGVAVLAACTGVMLLLRFTEDDHQRTIALRAELLEGNRKRFTADLLVNLARRNQNLIYRQLELLNRLEDHERDAEQLSHLFQLDHLATRIRRNAESLLVLSGEEPARKWGGSVLLVDVVRAAIAEIEELDRVDFSVDESLAVSGRAVADATHLLAELIENAVHFSPPGLSVMIRTRPYLPSPGAQVLTIEDWGVGMSPSDLADANDLLRRPRDVDLATSQRLGLHVVARLAARYQIVCTVESTPGGGVTAVVILPAELFAEVEGARTPVGAGAAVGRGRYEGRGGPDGPGLRGPGPDPASAGRGAAALNGSGHGGGPNGSGLNGSGLNGSGLNGSGLNGSGHSAGLNGSGHGSGHGSGLDGSGPDGFGLNGSGHDAGLNGSGHGSGPDGIGHGAGLHGSGPDGSAHGSGLAGAGPGLDGTDVDGSGLNGSGLNGSGLNGSGLNGSGLNGSGVNGSGVNGSGVNGSGVNGSGPDGAVHDGFGSIDPVHNGFGSAGSGLDGAGLDGAGLDGAGLSGAGPDGSGSSASGPYGLGPDGYGSGPYGSGPHGSGSAGLHDSGPTDPGQDGPALTDPSGPGAHGPWAYGPRATGSGATRAGLDGSRPDRSGTTGAGAEEPDGLTGMTGLAGFGGAPAAGRAGGATALGRAGVVHDGPDPLAGLGERRVPGSALGRPEDAVLPAPRPEPPRREDPWSSWWPLPSEDGPGARDRGLVRRTPQANLAEELRRGEETPAQPLRPRRDPAETRSALSRFQATQRAAREGARPEPGTEGKGRP